MSFAYMIVRILMCVGYIFVLFRKKHATSRDGLLKGQLTEAQAVVLQQPSGVVDTLSKEARLARRAQNVLDDLEDKRELVEAAAVRWSKRQESWKKGTEELKKAKDWVMSKLYLAYVWFTLDGLVVWGVSHLDLLPDWASGEIRTFLRAVAASL